MWLLSEDVANEMRALQRSGLMPTAEQLRQFEARMADPQSSDGLPRGMSVAGDQAEIRVEGVLTKKPSLWALWFGSSNSTYSDIISALAHASNDPTIKSVMFSIESPGGHVDGLYDTLAAIEAFAKPKRVRAGNAQSAAYAIAAVAGNIEATGAWSTFGSIGTAIDIVLWNDLEYISLTNTDSPEKRPDPKTPEGRASIVRYLDSVNELFVDAIAGGRGVKPDVVSKKYGRGATLLATEAQRLGMIDSVMRPALRAVRGGESTSDSAGSGGAQAEEKPMNLKELKAAHPDLCDELVKEGAASEKKRVCAHVKMARSTGATEIAFKAIESGASLHDDDVHADYMSFAMNKRDQQARQSDSDKAGDVVDGTEAEGKKTEEQSSGGKWLIVEGGKVKDNASH